MKFGYWVIGLLGYWVIFALTANAATLGLSIDPPIIKINAIPPTTATGSLTIQNKGDTQVTLQIQLKPFNAKGENGELSYSEETPDILKNVQILDAGLPVDNVTLGPQQQKTLNLNVIVPPDASIADSYFSIVFISASSSPIESNSSINQIGIATNVLLSVGPLEIPNATVEEFSSGIFFEKGPVSFTVRVKNTGTHLAEPKGEITIKNMFGQSIGKLDLTNTNVLSNSIRSIPNKNSTDFKRPVALWKESFLLGLYTATLNISMSNEGPTFTRSIHFFAFPLLGLIVVVVIVIIGIVIKKRLKLHMAHR